MNQNFKLKFDQLKDNYSAEEEPSEEETNLENELYDSASHSRNICFVLADGKSLFLNYAYLISCEYTPEENKIDIIFTTHSIELKGIRLESLFQGLFFHAIKKIVGVEKRYDEVRDKLTSSINEIIVVKIE